MSRVFSSRWRSAGVRLIAAGLVGAGAILSGTGSAAADSGPADLVVAPGGTVEPPIDCRPDAAHPNPVIVLPGGDGTTAQAAAQWEPMLSALRDEGRCALLFQAGVIDGHRWSGDMPTSARQVADFVAKVRAETGADRVDIVAHSVGGFVTNYFLKVLGGAADVRRVVLIAPETRGVDGTGALARYGLVDLPMTPVEFLQRVPSLRIMLAGVMPSNAGALQILPGSQVYGAVMDGPIAQPGVDYSVIATKYDRLATPPGTSSFIPEPGVTNVFYEDLFPDGPVVDHSTIRSDPDTVRWVAGRLSS